MEHAKKMILVDPRWMESQSGTQRPVPDTLANSLTNLDAEIRDVLDNTSYPESEKALQYDQILQRYLKLASKFRQRLWARWK